jgi:hypothetical protein
VTGSRNVCKGLVMACAAAKPDLPQLRALTGQRGGHIAGDTLSKPDRSAYRAIHPVTAEHAMPCGPSTVRPDVLVVRPEIELLPSREVSEISNKASEAHGAGGTCTISA